MLIWKYVFSQSSLQKNYVNAPIIIIVKPFSGQRYSVSKFCRWKKNYEQGSNLDRVCGIRNLGSNWTNQAELAPIWQASSDSGHSNSPNVGMSVARMSSNMALMWAGQPCGEMSCKCEEGDQMITKPLQLEAVWKISRNLSSLFLAQDFGFWRLK